MHKTKVSTTVTLRSVTVPNKKRSGVHIHTILEQGHQPLSHRLLPPLLGCLPSRVLCSLVLVRRMISLLDRLNAPIEEAFHHADPIHTIVHLASFEPLQEGDHLLHLFGFRQGALGVLYDGLAVDI